MKRLNKITLTEEALVPIETYGSSPVPVEEAEETAAPAFPRLSQWMEKIRIKPFPWKRSTPETL